MKPWLKKKLHPFKLAFKRWNDKDPFRESAIIAYYAIFSLPGLLVVVITLLGMAYGHDAASAHLHGQISLAMGNDTADQIQEMMVLASKGRNSVLATIIGIATLLFGATGVFVQLQKSLNIVWEVKAKIQKAGIWTFLRARLFSFGLILSIAFLLLISLVVSSVLQILSDWIKDFWPDYILFLFNIVNFIISLVIITILFAMMFKFMPDAKIKWRYVWIGSFFTSLLFTLGKTAMGLYFGKAEPGSGYGAAGSIILILLWVSYSSLILFYGAHFTKAYADLSHGYVPASDIAVKDPGRKV